MSPPPSLETPLPSDALPSMLSTAQAVEPRCRSIIRSFQQLRAWTVTSGDLGPKLSNLGPSFEEPGSLVVRKKPAKGQNHMELVSERARGHAGFWPSGRGNGQRKWINLDVKVMVLLCFRNIKQKNAAS